MKGRFNITFTNVYSTTEKANQLIIDTFYGLTGKSKYQIDKERACSDVKYNTFPKMFHCDKGRHLTYKKIAEKV